MDSLAYSPMAKQQLKDALFDFLYGPVKRSFDARLETLILRNCFLTGHSHKSFHYKGTLYSCDSEPPPRKWNKLMPQLKADMDAYLADRALVDENELPYVMGYITKVLNASQSIGDYLQLLPDCVHPPLQKLAATCPCQNSVLNERKFRQLARDNEASIALIKQRMVTNLLI